MYPPENISIAFCTKKTQWGGDVVKPTKQVVYWKIKYICKC